MPTSYSSATLAPHAFGVDVTDDVARGNLERTRQYLAAIEAASTPETAAAPLAFFAPDVVQVEYPNLFVPKGATRNLDEVIQAGERGRKVMRAQRYEVRTAMAHRETVALEVLWVGTVAVPVGTLSPGDEMRAHFGVFITFRDGLIIRQHNYDCFEPF